MTIQDLNKFTLPTKIKITNPDHPDTYNAKFYNKIFDVASIHIKKRKFIVGYSFSSYDCGNTSFRFDEVEVVQQDEFDIKGGK